MSYRQQQLLKTLGTWVLVGFISIQGYRLHKAGAYKHGFKNFKPAVGVVFGTFPLVGKSIRKWAYKGRKYRSRKAISKRGRKYRKSRKRRYRRRGKRRR